jgi:RhtB (resistance to homoserine/threonine) family protein
MEFFFAWLTVFTVNLLATMSPGPAFLMCLQSSIKYSRRTGVLTAVGLGLGLIPHVILTIGGVAVLLHESVLAFNIIKYAGAAYLIYIGWNALFSTPQSSKLSIDHINAAAQDISPSKALWQGALTNMLNPKATLFFVAIFAQFITPETLLWQKMVFGATSILVEMGWFSLVAVVLTNPRIKAVFSRFIHWIDRICGGLFIALGARLALLKGVAGS